MNTAEMRTEEIQIRDLYESAFLLCRGFRLQRMVVNQNGRASITFVIAGEGVTDSIEEFRSGRATANIALFTFTLDKLKDQMFTELRARERREKNAKNTSRRNRAAKAGN